MIRCRTLGILTGYIMCTSMCCVSIFCVSSETVQDILKIYPGAIQGKMKQIASITKRGFKEY